MLNIMLTRHVTIPNVRMLKHMLNIMLIRHITFPNVITKWDHNVKRNVIFKYNETVVDTSQKAV